MNAMLSFLFVTKGAAAPQGALKFTTSNLCLDAVFGCHRIDRNLILIKLGPPRSSSTRPRVKPSARSDDHQTISRAGSPIGVRSAASASKVKSLQVRLACIKFVVDEIVHSFDRASRAKIALDLRAQGIQGLRRHAPSKVSVQLSGWSFGHVESSVLHL